MDDIIGAIDGWRSSGHAVAVARAVTLSGLGGGRRGELLAIADDGRQAGTLVSDHVAATVGANAVTVLQSKSRAQELTVAVSNDEAAQAGLACGGTARVLIHSIDALPAELLDAVRSRVPVAIATQLQPPWTSAPVPAGSAVAAIAAELLGRGRSGSEVVKDQGEDVLVEAFLPAPRLLVVGAAELADALDRQARLLAWRASIASSALGIDEALAALGPADAVVVLSHDPEVDTPALTGALEAGVGFVGALGSRRTQGRRRERLAATGVAAEAIARIHAPVGLDIGAGSPEETAVAIFAEIIASRSGRAGQPLRDTEGPINP